ncbi:MAG: BatA domain-containing protein, partial [Polyangiaceae bacterium]
MHAIELLNPRGLLLLAALIPLVVMYILKIRRERLRVPSTWLWAAAERDLLAKHPFKKLVAQVPLILQILALLLLVLALSRPAARGGTIIGDHIAIVIDTSASMGASAHPHEAPGPNTATRMSE